MPQYFDPTRRAVAVTPPPVAVKAPARAVPAGYFDPRKPRRSRYPSLEEIAAFAESLDPVIRRNLDGLAAEGEMFEAWLGRRLGYVPRCEYCGALGDGEFGHRPLCRVFRVWRFAFEKFGWRRRRRLVSAGEGEWVEVEGADDDLPF